MRFALSVMMPSARSSVGSAANVVAEHPVEDVQSLLLAEVVADVVEDDHPAYRPTVGVSHVSDRHLVRPATVGPDDDEW